MKGKGSYAYNNIYSLRVGARLKIPPTSKKYGELGMVNWVAKFVPKRK
jgi:hypothetical protein